MDGAQRIQFLRDEALTKIQDAAGLEDLEVIRQGYLSPKGELTLILKNLRDLPSEERPKIGQLVNQAKDAVLAALEGKKSGFEKSLLEELLSREQIDETLPSDGLGVQSLGTFHPITLVSQRIQEIFSLLGFEVAQGPEVDTDFHNFEALNIPADHPAREMQDTLYLSEDRRQLLRSHTSTVQIRTMSRRQPPLRIIAPGAVFRADYDVTHTPMFHQVEGLVVDRGIQFSHLKGTLEFFAREMFGAGTRVRLRPSFFPFVEPGVEVDISCFQCGGHGKTATQQPCRLCKSSGWIEILGAGMVHPRVFEAVGYHPKEVTGFAFGMGVERIAMLKLGIPDLRLFYENDLGFLNLWGRVLP